MYSSEKRAGDLYLLDNVSVLPHSHDGGWFHEVPVLEAVVDQAAVKRVVVAPVLPLEVTITMVVSLFIGRYVTDDHVKLHVCGKREEKVYIIAYTIIVSEGGREGERARERERERRGGRESLTMNVIWKKPLMKNIVRSRMPTNIHPSIPCSRISSSRKKMENRPHTPRTMRKMENRTLQEREQENVSD